MRFLIDKTTILILGGVLLILFFLVIIGILPGKKESGPEAAQLEFWGMGDDESAWQAVITAFRKEYPNIEVTYKQFDESIYEENLINRLAEGRGPDIFVLKNTWVKKHRDKIYPLPQTVFQFSAIDFQKNFVEAASADLLTEESEILGLPLYIDTLALIYNRDAFNAAGIANPPETWDDLLPIARRFTQKTRAGDIIKSGIALGTASNIKNFFEILSALFIQNGDRITEFLPQKRVVLSERSTQALKFYASFSDPANPNFSWTARLPEDLEALATEKTVMAIGFAEDIKKIQGKNPHLNIGVASFPQPKDARTPLTYAGYLFPTVSRLSMAPDAAWRFILFATTGDSTQTYLERNNLAPARRDLIARGASNVAMDTFYRQTLIARGWPVTDEAASKNVFRESIGLLVSKATTPEQTIQRIKDRLGLLMH